MATPLVIKSSARPDAKYIRAIIFGGPNKGKSLALCTADKPVCLLTELTCAGSFARDVIEGAFGVPKDEDIANWLKSKNAKITPEEIKKALTVDRDVTLKLMTGITYDMPTLNIEDFTHLAQAIEILKTGQFDTAMIDSGSMLSRLLLEHFKAHGGKGGKPLADPRQAYKKAADSTLDFIRDLFKLPIHIFITAHAAERSINKGTEDEPIWIKYYVPAFEGNVLGREIPHMIREIWSAQIEGKYDNGRPKHVLRTRKKETDDYERTLCPRFLDEEPVDLAVMTRKWLNK